MPYTLNLRNQKAVLWLWDGTSVDDYGKAKPAVAIEISVRWEEVNKEVTDSEGLTIGIASQVVVDRDIPIGSLLWLGAIADIASPPVNIRQVVMVNKAQNFNGREIRRTVLLKKYSDSLPTLV